MIYQELQDIHTRPDVWDAYTADILWTDPHISAQMLKFHLDPVAEPASRNHAFIARSVDWIVERFELGPGKRVADFGCGPGLYTTRLAATGTHVTGIDFSARSLRYAREVAADRDLDITYVQQNYLDYETDQSFDLITLIYCDFCALNPSQRSILLRKFRSMLADDGAILLDVHTLALYRELEESADFAYRYMDGFWAAGDYYVFADTFKYDAEKVVLDKYTIIEPHRTRTVYNWLQYYTPVTLRAEFEEHDLRIEAQYANVAGDPWYEDAKEVAVIALKAEVQL